MRSMSMLYSIILPAFNESSRIGPSLEKALAFVREHLGDRAGNFRKYIDVFTARLVALDNAIGIDGRLERAADR